MKDSLKKHKAVGGEFLNAEPENVVRISWSGQHDTFWNEICADVVEVFGLPGNRFMYHPTPDFMDFHFKSTKDAELCRILVSHQL